MKVPFVDMQQVNARFGAEFEQALRRVLESGRALFGEETAAFETEFAHECGALHCVGVTSGLDALSLTLKAWISLGRLAPGDEVIVPVNSFVASALAVTESGLVVRFADVDPDTFNLTLESVATAMTDNVRAIMLVHLYGRLGAIESFKTYCREHDLLLLEDAAQAHGARSDANGARILGDAAGFSFYPTKNLGALGDAGCVVTNDRDLADRVRTLGNYGSSRKYHHEFRGTNSRMDELQASILRIKLRALESDNVARRDVARRYSTRISHPQVKLPQWPAQDLGHVWHLYVIVTPNRQAFVQHLAENGVETIVHYPCTINRQPAYGAESSQVDYPVSEGLQDQVLSLPISAVMSSRQVDHVIACVNSCPTSDQAGRGAHWQS